MLRKLSLTLVALAAVYLSGCASVPMASDEADKMRKEFSMPAPDKSGLYIFRDSNFGAALKKSIYIDGQLIGESAAKTYFYKDIKPGKHTLSTESEFSNNSLEISTKGGQNYFVRQYIKLGLVVGGANFEVVSDKEGKTGVLECKLAK